MGRWPGVAAAVVLWLCGGGGAATLAPSAALVRTTLGPVQGTVWPAFRQFLGVPYAQPPLRQLRFRPAAPKAAWGPKVWDATAYAPACPQLDKAMYYSEDCLYLNIWTPRAAPYVPWPVLVWIHGGAFSVGSGCEYNGSHIASRQGMVVVTINYRLGPLGFLAHPGLAREDRVAPATGGLNGLNDQLVALRWVRAHIAAFWGDPGRVTIAGESAGSISVCDIVASPRAHGLFHRAVMESGSCVGPWGPFPVVDGYRMSAAFMQSIGATSLAQLRSLSVYQLMNSSLWRQVGPSLDGWVLREPPAAAIARGALSLPAGARVMVGTTTLDSLQAPPYVFRDYPSTEAEYQRLLALYFDAAAPAVAEVYAEIGSNVSTRYKIMNADLCNVCPARSLAHQLGLAHVTAYVYQYAFNPDPGYRHLAFHGSEVPLLFASPTGPVHHFLFPFDAGLSEAMQQYWGSFARRGQPEGPEAWPPWDQRERHLVLNAPRVVLKEGYAAARCNFWGEKFQTVERRTQLFRFCWQLPHVAGDRA
eukprot:EG_transcript_7731